MIDTEKETLIQAYLTAYNAFDLQGMLNCLTEDIHFENYTGDQLTLDIHGLSAFARQAEEALSYFSKRKQRLITLDHQEQRSVAQISYVATLAMDFPNGMKKGEQIELNGRSEFGFAQQKINYICDKS